MTVQIWSVDPGLLSGWCHLSVVDNEVSLFKTGEADHFEIGKIFHDNPFLTHASEHDFTIIVESFKQNARMKPSPYSLETIGLIRYFAHFYNIPFVIINPFEHKTLITNAVIKRAGLWSSTKGGHANDAVRMSLWYLIVKRELLTGCLQK